MAKDILKFDLKSALKRKAAQRKKYASLPIAKKLKILDQMHDGLAFFAGREKK
jgi:hypothetical protein